MIEGLFIDVPSEDLRQHLLGRADYHRARQGFYETQFKAISEKMGEVAKIIEDEDNETVRDAWANGSSSYGNQRSPADTLRASARTHRARAAFFAFLGMYVIKAETYRLDEKDLERLELVSQHL
jgi:hypothetical protein